MKQKYLFSLILSAMSLAACNDTPREEKGADKPVNFEKGSLGYDFNFLKKYDSNLIQLKSGDAAVLVSAKYQAKVFTSGALGDAGASFGWINYKAFDAPIDAHMNAYGGENRLWLGPEGGKYSVFFQPGDSMVFDKWKTPASIDTETWEIGNKSESSVQLTKSMALTNYVGTALGIKVIRTVTIADKSVIENDLGINLEDSIRFVGYHTENQLTNAGTTAWDEKTGMPCIWILDMFNPSPSTTIVIPFLPGPPNEKVATTDYFGEIAADRIKRTDKTLFFKADGKSRGKLGIVPSRVLPFAGSYDANGNVLTIAHFTIDNKARYLNQEWNIKKPVFSGDAMNAYNDGPLADGSQMGPFYEIESVSPAAALAPGQSIEHKHDVYHFTGSKSKLNTIALKLLGVPLDEIENSFKP